MSLRHTRAAGDPDRSVIDVSDEFGAGGGALLLTNGVPDYVLTPEGFSHGPISAGARCDVLKVYRNAEVACPVCPATTTHKLWFVHHIPTQTRLVVYECSACSSFSWALAPAKEV